jgi:hypothetical protein
MHTTLSPNGTEQVTPRSSNGRAEPDQTNRL